MKLMLFVFMLVVAAGLGGCVTSHATYTPTGQRGFAISCSGAAHTWGDCLSAAGDDCTTQGFTVLSRNGTSVPIEYFNANDNTQIKAKLFAFEKNEQSNVTSFRGPAIHRTMVVACGHPPTPPVG